MRNDKLEFDKGGIPMKKKLSIIWVIAVIVIVAVAAIVLHQPYKPITFEVDGENYSAMCGDGGSLILDLNNDNNGKKWSITQNPECYASDYDVETETFSEFHIIALSEGKDVMEFQCVNEDGTIENYELTLSISRHKKNHLQIEFVSFEKTD